ncbi:rhomboid family intramembrane serine protease [Chitinophaga barathri]|uniref:Rhomboid family intramembrane serine protease n=1 Tax=Chitinophaga barathri TaxID=1647451 RepID=A0A3N4M9C1_9BACT|nr:rhomboid family intramembrane serine protease [Chitinophaga barathri]RPD40282.1 rhomboid family intramembrane serine protease [Chitinophaga barathri]
MIGFPPRYGTTYFLENRSAAEQLVIFWLAVEKMGWQLSEVTSNSITAFTNFSLRSWNEQVSIRFTPEEINLFSVSTGVQVLDFGRNRQNIKRLLKAVAAIAAETPGETLTTVYEERQHRIRPEGETIHLTRSRPVVAGFMQVFRPVKGYFITPIIIVLNVFIFLLLTNKWLFPESSGWAPHQDVLERAGASFKPLTLFGEPWRLVTSSFLHADVLHLFFNMYGIMVCGIYLEPLLGRWRFLLVYILCGIMASLSSLWWYDITPTLGASGAVFGLFGFILTLSLHHFLEPGERRALLTSIGLYIVLSFSTIFLSTNFDHASHIGGLLAGMLLAQLLYAGLQKNATRSVMVRSTALATALMLVIISAVYVLLPRDVTDYMAKRARLDENYILASGVYHARNDEERMKWLKNYSIYYMDENLRIMDEIDRLSLSIDSKQQNKLLRKLYNTRKQLFTWNYQTLHEGRNRYDKQILEAMHDLEKMHRQLNY